MSKRGVLVALFAYNARLLNLGNALVSFESQPQNCTLGVVFAHYLYFLSNAERCPPLGKLLLLNLALAGIRARTASMFVYARHFYIILKIRYSNLSQSKKGHDAIFHSSSLWAGRNSICLPYEYAIITSAACLASSLVMLISVLRS